MPLLLTTSPPLRENGTQEREKKERNYVQSSKNSFEKKTATFLIHRVYTKRYVLDFFSFFSFFLPSPIISHRGTKIALTEARI